MATSAAAESARASRWPAVLAWAVAGVTMLSLVPGGWLASQTWLAGVESAPPTIATVGPVVLVVVSATTVGALVASHRPRHPVGWLLLGVGLGVATNVLVEPYVKYGLLVRPGSLPGARHLVGLVYSSFFVALSCAGFVLLLTPTGSLPSPRWRWWARVAAAAPVVTMVGLVVQSDPLAPEYYGNALAIPALAPVLLPAALAGIVVVALSLLIAAGSMVVRFRRARGVERLQLRWLALAAALASLLLLVALVAGAFGRDPVVLASLALCLALLPLATGASILRYRLYDLDHIISRTVAWTLLTALLGLGYAAVVLGLGRLLPESSSLVVAAATLAVAAMFQPARRRVQEVVDRRFNRRRFDAARTVDAFAARLRDQVDLDALTGELLAVADRTMQPTTASLWLRQRAAGEQTTS
ncbi:MAG TPA: hypothetical protein VF468_09450 [Actinomycetota bacterium]|nr:hypothetical protein [Actinomycetota bacterium]